MTFKPGDRVYYDGKDDLAFAEAGFGTVVKSEYPWAEEEDTSRVLFEGQQYRYQEIFNGHLTYVPDDTEEF